jgi:DNA repair protein SbcD/Mre11
MTKFTFLHAADLHLGSPFLGLSLKDEDVARRLASASREAFTTLVEAAIAEKVAFVVIAGDVYDGEWRDASIGLYFSRQLARLERAGIRVILLKGNHDAESVVTKTVTLPASVQEFSTRAARTVRLEDLRVALHGRSFPDRVVAENYVPDYPAAVPGWFNIGVLHTSCAGYAAHASYAPCTLQDLATRGYQYWALGHVHAYEVLCTDPYVVYPGNIQGRSIRETGAKGAVLVDVEDGVVKETRRLIVDKARWALARVDLSGCEDEDEALRRIEESLSGVASQARGTLLIARVELTGTTTLHRRLLADTTRLRDEVQAAADRCHDDIWIESVVSRLGAPVTKGGRIEPGFIDPTALIAGLEHDATVRTRALDLLASVSNRLPANVAEEFSLAHDLDTLMDDAASLVLGRLTREER